MIAKTWMEGTFPASDGYPLFYRRYPALGRARAEVVCLHGIQSHSGWYEQSCQRLAREGFDVFFLDRRGSGRNRVARGDAPSYGRLLDDVAEFMRPLPPLNSHRLPRFLLGISWGGKLAVGLQKRHPGLAAGLALLCPGFCPKVRPPFLQRLAIGVAKFGAPRKLFPIPLNDPELFTANPAKLEFLRDDPLALHDATARFLIESVRLDRFVRRSAPSVAVPTVLMLAGKDRIIDNDRTRQLARRFYGPVEILEYPEARHTLEFEGDIEFFTKDLIGWLNRKLITAR